MKFVVTGGAGFIGSNIARQLIKDNHDIIVIDNLHSGRLDNLTDSLSDIEFKKLDVSDFEGLRKIVNNVDGVFHEAALTVVQESFQKKDEYWNVNVKGAENIFKLAKDFGFKVVFASSSSVYGNTTKIPIKENFKRKSINPYGQTKLEAEYLVEKYADLEVNIIGLRYFNVYGERQNPAYAGVITKFMERITANLPPIIYGDGLQIRDFVYVKDVAKANVKAMTCTVKHGFFNIGTGDAVSIKDLANMMIKSSRLQLRPIHEKSQDGDIRLSQADMALTKKTLQWEASTKLQKWLDEIMTKIVSR